MSNLHTHEKKSWLNFGSSFLWHWSRYIINFIHFFLKKIKLNYCIIVSRICEFCLLRLQIGSGHLASRPWVLGGQDSAWHRDIQQQRYYIWTWGLQLWQQEQQLREGGKNKKKMQQRKGRKNVHLVPFSFFGEEDRFYNQRGKKMS